MLYPKYPFYMSYMWVMHLIPGTHIKVPRCKSLNVRRCTTTVPSKTATAMAMAALCPSVRWSLKVSEWSGEEWGNELMMSWVMSFSESSGKNTKSCWVMFIVWFPLLHDINVWCCFNVVDISGEDGRTAMGDAAERRWHDTILPLGESHKMLGGLVICWVNPLKMAV